MASAVAAVALLAGCNTENDFENGKDGLASLELSSVSSSDMLTRAVIDGTAFPTDKGNIGLFLYEDAATSKPYGEGYVNVQYSYNSTKEKWTANPSIKVGSTSGYLYGYYPYNAANTNVMAIPVTSSVNGDDVMYASQQDAITDKTAANTTLKMNHALARVAITVINNGYTGDAKLSSIKFEGAEIASSGTLNATDGSITASKADGVTLSVPEAEQPIATGGGSAYECLLVPSSINNDSRQTVTISLTIDGEVKSLTLSDDNGVVFKPGVKSIVTITLSNTGIALKSVSINDWQTVEVGGHKVTVRLADDTPASDVTYSTYFDGASVKIATVSREGHIMHCLADGNEVTGTETNKYYDFTLPEITDDVEVIVGYLKYTASVALKDGSVPNQVKLKINGKEASSVSLFPGDDVTYDAVELDGFSMLGWYDAEGNLLSKNIPYTIKDIQKDIELKAEVKEGYRLKVNIFPNGAGSVNNLEFYDKLAHIDLTATPISGAKFKEWRDKSGNVIGTSNKYAIDKIGTNTELTAVFELEDMLKGQFTVDASGKKVSFAKGNLWYGKVGDAAAATFNFEDDQYGFATTISGSNTYWDENHVSYFQWGSTAEKSMEYNSKGNFNSEKNLFTNAADDSSKPNSGFVAGGITGFWRTLSQPEWEFLLSTRSGSTVNGTENARYFQGQIQKEDETLITGLFVIPDNFTWPISVDNVATKINIPNAGFTVNTYSITQFEELEEAGIVFLPVAGYISATTYTNTKQIAYKTTSFYWTSSTYPSSNNTYILRVGSTIRYSTKESSSNVGATRMSGGNIRLVGDL